MGVVVDVANEGSGASTRVFEGVTLASPSGNERDEVRWDEWGSEEDGEDDEEDMHCGDAGVFDELRKTAHADRAFIGSMDGLAWSWNVSDIVSHAIWPAEVEGDNRKGP